MQYKFTEYHEAKLYIGNKKGYHGEEFSKANLVSAIKEYQSNKSKDDLVSVRISETCFVVGTYYEDGWEVSAINYPRFPKPKMLINTFMLGLAKFLIEKFNQNRISVTFPDQIVMVESEEAEQN